MRINWPSLPEFRDIESELYQVWSTGFLTTASFTKRFEEAVASYAGVRHAIAVNSCTSGLMLLLRALGVRGEVILPSFTFAATALAVLWNGLKPVFVDVDPSTYTLDPARVEAAITDDTSAIVPVNVFGLPPAYSALCQIGDRYRLKVIVDSAQGLGAGYFGRPVGGFGNAEVFSLSPTKVVTAVEGGVITTSDDLLAHLIRQMRDYGKSLNGEDICWQGLSARFSELHAIIGYHNLKRIEELRSKRFLLMGIYTEGLTDLRGISFQKVPEGYRSSGNYIAIQVGDETSVTRDQLHEFLKSEGIESKRYFYPALHRQELFARLGMKKIPPLPITEHLSATCLALPLYDALNDKEVLRVVESIRRRFDNLK